MQGLPWLVGGDFNEILFASEKIGGATRSLTAMQNFSDTLDRGGLIDLQGHDSPFTWYNKKKGVDAIFERLDRMVANTAWFEMFPLFSVKVLDFYGSDHRPLVLDLRKSACKKTFVKRRFYFEGKWLMEDSFIPEFLWRWEDRGGFSSLPDRLRDCQEFLKQWAGQRFDGLGKKIKALRKRREIFLSKQGTKRGLKELQELDKELDILLDKEEFHWKQRGRLNWLQHGDRNSSYFHHHASARKKKNQIEGLFDDNGRWVTKDTEVAQVIMTYFHKLFTSSNPSPDVVEGVAQRITVSLSEQ